MKTFILCMAMLFLGVGAFAQTKDSLSFSPFPKKKEKKSILQSIAEFVTGNTGKQSESVSTQNEHQQSVVFISFRMKEWSEQLSKQASLNMTRHFIIDQYEYYGYYPLRLPFQ
jgi:hypothetical protein